MKISDLKAGTGNVSLTATVIQKEEPREVVNKFGKRLTVANITLKDETGTINMSLWGDDINTVKTGDKIELSNCYVNEFRGVPQLSTGKFGKIKVVSSGASDGEGESEDSMDMPDLDEDSEDNEDQ
ncbi:OB-fold nucleic acid binding domain-containing protein [Candidatus Marsarchaeota archaeon]|nr:OB-fold nucleic acid binding domain-containing protein [Candidatus Marsarchaeota archaeon]MCL5404895.1 OB-fold nucleic acid binding domain-containing protein [Candidatus Marsarchaeota archaeon]